MIKKFQKTFRGRGAACRVPAAGMATTLLLLCLASCNKQEPGKYVNRDQGFAVQFPREWELKESEMGFAVIGLSPLEGPSDDFRDNLGIASSEMTKPLDADGITFRFPSAAFPTDAAVTPRSRFLYTLNAGTGTVGMLGIEPDGSLTYLGEIDGLPIFDGAQGIAAF